VARSFQHGSENSGPRKGGGGSYIEQLEHLRASEVAEYSLEVVN
jgi:hypothetical protein